MEACHDIGDCKIGVSFGWSIRLSEVHDRESSIVTTCIVAFLLLPQTMKRKRIKNIQIITAETKIQYNIEMQSCLRFTNILETLVKLMNVIAYFDVTTIQFWM